MRRPSASRTCPRMQNFARCLRPSSKSWGLAGVESFSAAWQPALNDLPGAEAEAWLDLIERTGQTAEGLSA